MALQTWSQDGHGFLRQYVLSIPVTLDSTAVDARNTDNTSHLLAGLTLGLITAQGTYKEYNSGGSDGSETATGILMADVELDSDGTARDTPGDMLVIGTVVNSGSNLGLWDAAAAADLAGQIFVLTE